MKPDRRNSRPELSRIVHGMMRLKDWNLSRAALLDLITRSVDMGITTFDHADIYGDHDCEKIFGEAIASAPSLRSRIQIVTKCGIMLMSEKFPGRKIKHYDTSRRHIIESAENSLKRLGTDYIDLLLIHRPDPLMDPDEIAGAFDSLKEKGMVLYFGVSNFSPSRFDFLSANLGIPLAANQVECSVLHLDPFEDGTLDSCMINDVIPMAWSPLGGGELLKGSSRKTSGLRRILETIGESHGDAQADTIALAWLMKHPSGIIPIIGTGNSERIDNALKALDIEMTREEWFQIWSASRQNPVP